MLGIRREVLENAADGAMTGLMSRSGVKRKSTTLTAAGNIRMNTGSILHHSGTNSGTSDVTHEIIMAHEERKKQRLSAETAKQIAKSVKERKRLASVPERLATLIDSIGDKIRIQPFNKKNLTVKQCQDFLKVLHKHAKDNDKNDLAKALVPRCKLIGNEVKESRANW